MQRELQDKLREKHPEVFDGQENTPLNHWGIECGDGWYAILDALFSILKQSYWQYPSPANDGDDNAIATLAQVKEKFGQLRVYVDWKTKPSSRRQLLVEGAVIMAETLSRRTCENCSDTKTAKIRSGGWLRCLCDNCQDKYDEEVDDEKADR